MRTASRNTSTTAMAVIALAVASMLAPSLAHAKRMGGGGRMMAPNRMARPATPPPRSAQGASGRTRTRSHASCSRCPGAWPRHDGHDGRCRCRWFGRHHGGQCHGRQQQ